MSLYVLVLFIIIIFFKFNTSFFSKYILKRFIRCLSAHLMLIYKKLRVRCILIHALDGLGKWISYRTHAYRIKNLQIYLDVGKQCKSCFYCIFDLGVIWYDPLSIKDPSIGSPPSNPL